MQKVSLFTASKMVREVIKSNLVPAVFSSPGIGKSSMFADVAKAYNLELIDIRLAQEDPTSLNGFPDIRNGRSDFAPPKRFPLEGDPLPDGKNGWLVLFDELPSAPKAIQAASYKIILDRMIGNNRLHENCRIACAGNLMSDGAVVFEMGSALRSRMVHIHVESAADGEEGWLTQYAYKANLDPRVTAFIKYQPSALNMFDPKKLKTLDAETFACERTWDFASKYLQRNYTNKDGSLTKISHHGRIALEGIVGPIAREFAVFADHVDELPTLQEILNDPANANIPSSRAAQYLVTTMTAQAIDTNNVSSIAAYLLRLPEEFILVAVRMLYSGKPTIMANKSVQQLTDKVVHLLSSR